MINNSSNFTEEPLAIENNIIFPSHDGTGGNLSFPTISPSQNNNSAVTNGSSTSKIAQTEPERPSLKRKTFWLPARSSSGDSIEEPEPRAKRVQVRRNQQTYTSLEQVVGRVSRSMKNEYEYDPLDGEDEIRLLVINPAKNILDPLYCTLALSINEEKSSWPYEALSYMWGAQDATEAINLFYPKLRGVLAKNSQKGNKTFQMSSFWAKFYVRPNLYSALQHLRHRTKHVYLWVDALCIDQNNNQERSIQVTKMAEIYNRASYVRVWLGPGDMQSKLALNFIHDLLDGTNLDRLVRDASSCAHWVALAELMRNQWFSRRWIVQEVALARQSTLRCGTKSVFFRDFVEAVHCFIDNIDEVSQLPFTSAGSVRGSSLGHIRNGAWILCQAMNDYFPTLGGDGSVARKASLETLISKLTSFEASEPRDIIYAALSLAKDTFEGDHDGIPALVPDYDKGITDVFRDFVEFSIHQSDSLDIICRCWAPIVKLPDNPDAKDESRAKQRKQSQRPIFMKFPSWIRSVEHAVYGRPKEHLVGRMNGDSFVGTPDRKLYNATPRTIPIYRFGQKNDETANSLYVKGFVLDVVEKVGNPITQQINREDLALGGLELNYLDDSPDVAEVPDQLWRTMVADQGPNGEAPHPTYPRSCQKCLGLAERGDINVLKLIEAGEDKMMIRFLKRVRDVVYNRKFIRSASTVYHNRGNYKSRKLFGLAPREVGSEDLICILLGCSVPVILRKMADGKQFKLIGEAYIYGMMNGDALGGRKQKQLQKECEEFELI